MDTFRDKASRWFDWDAIKSMGAGRSDADESPEHKISKAVQKKERNKPGENKHQEDHETINWDKLGIGKFDVMNLTIETMQSALVQYKIAGYPPDLLVNIPKNASRSYDYHKAPELIQLGRERMAAALDRFEESRSSSGPLAI